jgi:hypothetical protein
VLGLFIYTPMEGLPGAPPASTPVSPAAQHLLFSAAVLLWCALGLFLATPSLPWLYINASRDPARPMAYTATAYSVSFCTFSGVDNICQTVTLQNVQDALFSSGGSNFPRSTDAPAAAIVASATAIAVCGEL